MTTARPPLMTISQLARATGLPRSTVYEAIRDQRFPVEGIRVGSRVYVRRRDVEAVFGLEEAGLDD